MRNTGTTGEDLYVKNLDNGLRAMRLGTKKPLEELNMEGNLNRLKKTNFGLFEDYFDKYQKALKEYNRNKK